MSVKPSCEAYPVNSMMTFPPNWGRRRIDELRVAVYSGVVGFIFLTTPEVLLPYPTAFGGPDRAWLIGLCMMSVATAHSAALWLNGANAALSRLIRGLACLAHACIILTFGWGFLGVGAYWGAASMGLVLVLIWSALYRVACPGAR